jgi:hypothetical protein
VAELLLLPVDRLVFTDAAVAPSVGTAADLLVGDDDEDVDS